MMESADDAIPAVEVYRGVPIEDQQPAARIEGIVKPTFAPASAATTTMTSTGPAPLWWHRPTVTIA